MTEYLYDWDNPKSSLRQRITGVEGFYYGLPNINERAEMVNRALLREYDNDVTKFANMLKKPRDEA